ncbi:hypothetical protein GYB57_02485 [bacterium]|nr:hypothetical protein [bacterium]
MVNFKSQLKIALEEFWNWAGITPVQYNNDKLPNNNVLFRSEWEEEYPKFSEIESAFIKSLLEYKSVNNKDLLSDIFEAIAIDHVDGGFLDKLLQFVSNENGVIEDGVNFWMKNTRWQFAMQLYQTNVTNQEEILRKLAMSDSSSYVRQVAMNTLYKLKSIYLKEVCELNMQHENPRLREISYKLLAT